MKIIKKHLGNYLQSTISLILHFHYFLIFFLLYVHDSEHHLKIYQTSILQNQTIIVQQKEKKLGTKAMPVKKKKKNTVKIFNNPNTMSWFKWKAKNTW